MKNIEEYFAAKAEKQTAIKMTILVAIVFIGIALLA